MILWEVISWLARLDVHPAIGWNWFSIFCFILMFVHGMRKSIRIYNPDMKTKLLPLVIVCSAFTLLFYYSFMDIPANFIQAALSANSSVAVAEAFSLHLDVRRIPANIPALVVYSIFVFLLTRKFLNFKWFIMVFLLQQVFIFAVIITFGTFNMRYLEGDARTLFYLAFTIPGWIFWLIGYRYFWKSDKEIVKYKIRMAAE